MVRSLYRNHVEIGNSEDEIYYCADLQKVIMLPAIDQFKTCISTRRLTTFNGNFVPLGSTKKSQSLAILWHEGVSNRKKEDLVSTFFQFFLTFRDSKRINLWLDNCSAQNKNWCLITFLIYIINSTHIKAESIQLFYFEPGHTFMAADSIITKLKKQ